MCSHPLFFSFLLPHSPYFVGIGFLRAGKTPARTFNRTDVLSQDLKSLVSNQTVTHHTLKLYTQAMS